MCSSQIAARFNAIIVPFGAVGWDDNFKMLLDSSEILQLPLVGEKVRQWSTSIPSARALSEERFIYPVTVPAVPSRHYLMFGKVF
jgi:hypothetical protein